MFAQLNSLARDAAVPFDGLVDSLFSDIARTHADALVIDLRNNQGGDGSLAQALVHSIIRTPHINQRGHVYVITGRATFSAAVILAAALEKETNATFVGEPTGAPANHYGEPSRIELPRTKLRLSYSRLYWQNGDPRDRRPWIAPSIPVALTFDDWRANRDAAFETILALRGSPVRPVPILRVGGDYPTDVVLLSDACGGTDIAPNPTRVKHNAGDTLVTITHAGNAYEGVVKQDGSFVTRRRTLVAGDVSYDVSIAGQFTGDGLRAYVVIGVRDPKRSGPCQYVVGWNGLRTNGFNVIPGR
jgi:hypothetical protein